MTLENEDKNKKKKARKALILFLTNLRGKCGSFGKIDEWFNFLKANLDPLISQYGDVISHDYKTKLEDAKKLTDKTVEGINNACHTLQANTEKIIKMLPRGSIFGKAIIIGTVFTSGVIAAAVLYFKTSVVKIAVVNKNCATIRPITFMPVKIPGLSLFTEPILAGGKGSISVFPLPVSVDATSKNSIMIGLMGVNFPVPGGAGGAAKSITFNGSEILGKKVTLNLKEKSSHEVVISCL